MRKKIVHNSVQTANGKSAIFYKMVSYFCMKFKKVWYWKFNKIFDLSKSKAFHKTFLKVRLKLWKGWREGGQIIDNFPDVFFIIGLNNFTADCLPILLSGSSVLNSITVQKSIFLFQTQNHLNIEQIIDPRKRKRIAYIKSSSNWF